MDFPCPDGPTIAVDSPALILKLTFSNKYLYSFGAVGYLKVTFLNPIEFFRVNSEVAFYVSIIFGTLSIT